MNRKKMFFDENDVFPAFFCGSGLRRKGVLSSWRRLLLGRKEDFRVAHDEMNSIVSLYNQPFSIFGQFMNEGLREKLIEIIEEMRCSKGLKCSKLDLEHIIKSNWLKVSYKG